MVAKGTLYFVVGPSGSGKDTLIAIAKRARPDIHVVQRVITRPVTENDCNHTEMNVQEFVEARRANRFALTWDANGFRYGVPCDVFALLDAGEAALVNGSRAAVDDARRIFDPIKIVYVTAKLDELARRLRTRGREDPSGIASCMARAGRNAPSGADVVSVDNSGSLEDGLDAFLAALN